MILLPTPTLVLESKQQSSTAYVGTIRSEGAECPAPYFADISNYPLARLRQM